MSTVATVVPAKSRRAPRAVAPGAPAPTRADLAARENAADIRAVKAARRAPGTPVTLEEVRAKYGV